MYQYAEYSIRYQNIFKVFLSQWKLQKIQFSIKNITTSKDTILMFNM